MNRKLAKRDFPTYLKFLEFKKLQPVGIDKLTEKDYQEFLIYITCASDDENSGPSSDVFANEEEFDKPLQQHGSNSSGQISNMEQCSMEQLPRWLLRDGHGKLHVLTSELHAQYTPTQTDESATGYDKDYPPTLYFESIIISYLKFCKHDIYTCQPNHYWEQLRNLSSDIALYLTTIFTKYNLGRIDHSVRFAFTSCLVNLYPDLERKFFQLKTHPANIDSQAKKELRSFATFELYVKHILYSKTMAKRKNVQKLKPNTSLAISQSNRLNPRKKKKTATTPTTDCEKPTPVAVPVSPFDYVFINQSFISN